jgi:hypothetical protein
LCRIGAFTACLLIAGNCSITAQSNASAIRIEGMTLTGSLRTRIENWDWFNAPPAENAYTYGSAVLRLDLGRSYKKLEWHFEASFPVFVNLPEGAVAPGPQGPIGYGGDYFLINGERNVVAASLRQGYVALKSDDGRLQFRMGRFEFADGAEVAPPDPDLAALKRDRINQRLIGTFNYALRSLDGAQFKYQWGRSQVTGLAARVVEGSFRLRALDEIDVELGYAGYTRYFPGQKARSEVRLFGLYYQDGRGTLKTDNRPQALLDADHRPIRLATPGAHFISEINAGRGTADVVVWVAGQFGAWGVQRDLAAEGAAEAGYRFPGRARPWIRAGYLRSTGDPNPGDTHHNTFFQVLSSPRAYARFPFYTLMNTEDAMLQFRVMPTAKLALRSELHSVHLSDARDLWYDGGGAFEEGSAGYLGRPSGGRRKVGTSLDLSADYALSPKTTVSVYGGLGRGSAVPAFVFPSDGHSAVVHLLSIELTRRF